MYYPEISAVSEYEFPAYRRGKWNCYVNWKRRYLKGLSAHWKIIRA